MKNKLSIAPMLDLTDRHCRYFLRLLSRHTLLYTEMVTSGAILHGDVERHLRFDVAEQSQCAFPSLVCAIDRENYWKNNGNTYQCQW